MALKCMNCGGPLIKKPGGRYVCEFCGAEYEDQTTGSTSAAEQNRQRAASLLAQADHNQENGDYDEAYYLYIAALETDPENGAAYWGKVLSKYGVLYVSETQNGRTIRKPTLNRMSPTSILEDPDYLSAIKYADAGIAETYKADAAVIAGIQKKYLELIAQEPPFDVFISFKAEDTTTGEASEDSVIAYEIYERLNSLGNLNVFFSKVTLQEKAAGKDYEPIIYAALNTAKVMILVGTSRKNVDSRWVKNEWSRFLMQMQADSSKAIIPVVKGISGEELPERIPLGNVISYEGENTLALLTEGVLNLTGKGTVIDEDDTEHLISELREQLKEACASGDYRKVRETANEVLDIDAEYGEAYYYLLLAEYKVKSSSALARLEDNWSESRNYRYAMRFGDENLISRLNAAQAQQQILKEDKEKEALVRAEKERQEKALQEAFAKAKGLMKQYRYSDAQKILTTSAYRHPQAKAALDTCNSALEAANAIGDRSVYYESQLKKKNPQLFASLLSNNANMQGLKTPKAAASTYKIRIILSVIGILVVGFLSSSHPYLGVLIGAALGLYGTLSCGEMVLSIAGAVIMVLSMLFTWAGAGNYYGGSSPIGPMTFAMFLVFSAALAVAKYLRANRYEKIMAENEAVQEQLSAFLDEEMDFLQQNYFSKLEPGYVKTIAPLPITINGTDNKRR